MQIGKEFLDGIAELVRSSMPNMKFTDGRGYDHVMKPDGGVLDLGAYPNPHCFKVASLQGGVDALEAHGELSAGSVCCVAADGFSIYGGPEAKTDKRLILVEGRADVLVRDPFSDASRAAGFPLGEAMSVEHFIVGLRSCFEQSDTRDRLLEMVSAIVTSGENKVEDTGLSQLVTIRRGIQMVGKEEVPNPVKLKPYRTFREVDQPESEFLLRVREAKGDVFLTLHLADGGAWRYDAREAITTWFAESKAFGKFGTKLVA